MVGGKTGMGVGVAYEGRLVGVLGVLIREVGLAPGFSKGLVWTVGHPMSTLAASKTLDVRVVAGLGARRRRRGRGSSPGALRSLEVLSVLLHGVLFLPGFSEGAASVEHGRHGFLGRFLGVHH